MRTARGEERVRRRGALWAGLGLGGITLGSPWVALAGVGAAESGTAARLKDLLVEQRELLRRRGEYQRALTAAENAERVALGDLAGIEVTLRRLVSARTDLRARLSPLEGEVAGLESALGEEEGSARDRLAADLAAARRRQAGLVDQLGQANTEITHWQGQADRAARRVGDARSRALDASTELAELQVKGLHDAEQIVDDLRSLGAEGYGAGGQADLAAVGLGHLAALLDAILGEYGELLGPSLEAIMSTGPERAWPPVLWPSGSPPVYSPPRGVISPVLVAGTPLTAEAARAAIGAGERADDSRGAGSWARPVSGPITTRYGASTPYFSTHWAVDIGTKLYAPVVAVAQGRVEHVGLATANQPHANHGMVVVVRHGPRFASLYAHLDAAAFAPPVRNGEEAGAGQVIGYAGLTGYSTGPHLHFEVRVDNRPIDPGLVVPSLGS